MPLPVPHSLGDESLRNGTSSIRLFKKQFFLSSLYGVCLSGKTLWSRSLGYCRMALSWKSKTAIEKKNLKQSIAKQHRLLIVELISLKNIQQSIGKDRAAKYQSFREKRGSCGRFFFHSRWYGYGGNNCRPWCAYATYDHATMVWVRARYSYAFYSFVYATHLAPS